ELSDALAQDCSSGLSAAGASGNNGAVASLANSGGGSGDGASSSSSQPGSTVIVNYLPSSIGNNELKKLFESVGPTTNSIVVRDRITKESKCFGFVSYESPNDAERAVEVLNGRLIQDKCIRVGIAIPQQELGHTGNLPEGYAQSDLDKLFDSYGPLKESKLLMDKRTGKSKGCGFIELCSGPLADMAIAQLNGLQLDGAPQPLKVHRPLPPKGALLLGGQVGAAGVSPVNQLTVKHELLPAHIRPFGVAAGLHPTDGLLSPPNKKRRTDTAEEALTAAVAAHQQQPKQDKGEFPLFVYGLGDAAQDIDLWELFGPHGAVKSVKVIRDAATQKPRGYGFVTMLR
uniref:Rna-binding protein elav/hu rrm superfamily n=1 Tax=Macrostomum lignano TaxID=282301 RepID=A0A1I8H7L7_9PLAT